MTYPHPTILWQELSTNQKLHKGVEFGVKAAGEVSKDVGEQVGKHAASVYIGRKLGGDPGEPKWTTGLGPAPGLIWTGAKSYRDFPEKGKDIGKRIQNIHDEVYGKGKK